MSSSEGDTSQEITISHGKIDIQKKKHSPDSAAAAGGNLKSEGTESSKTVHHHLIHDHEYPTTEASPDKPEEVAEPEVVPDGPPYHKLVKHRSASQKKKTAEAKKIKAAAKKLVIDLKKRRRAIVRRLAKNMKEKEGGEAATMKKILRKYRKFLSITHSSLPCEECKYAVRSHRWIQHAALHQRRVSMESDRKYYEEMQRALAVESSGISPMPSGCPSPSKAQSTDKVENSTASQNLFEMMKTPSKDTSAAAKASTTPRTVQQEHAILTQGAAEGLTTSEVVYKVVSPALESENGDYDQLPPCLSPHSPQKAHRPPSPSVCEICDRWIGGNFGMHRKIHEKVPGRDIPCTICPQTWFISEQTKKKHLMSVHPREYRQMIKNGTYGTPKQQRRMLNTTKLSLLSDSGVSFQTAMQNFSSSPRSSQSRGKQKRAPLNLQVNEDGTTTEECPTCHKQIASARMMQHCLVHKRTAHRQLACEFCESYFISETGIVFHMTTEHPDKPPPVFFGAPQSNAYSAASDNFGFRREVDNTTAVSTTDSNENTKEEQQHKSTTGEEEEDKERKKTESTNSLLLRCEICQLYVYRPTQHALTHSRTSDKQVECPVCPTTYLNDRYVLKKHLAKHHPGVTFNDDEGESPVKVPNKRSSSKKSTSPHKKADVGNGRRKGLQSPTVKTIKMEIRKSPQKSMKLLESLTPTKIVMSPRSKAMLKEKEKGKSAELSGKKPVNMSANLNGGLEPEAHEDNINSELVTCNVCKLQMTAYTLSQHQAVHVRTEQRSIACLLCPSYFTRNDKLKKHMEMRHNTSLESMIGQTVKQQSTTVTVSESPAPSADSGSGSVPGSANADLVECSVCGRQMHKYVLGPHMVLHKKTKERCLPCEVCKETYFANRTALLAHRLKVHNLTANMQSPSPKPAKNKRSVSPRKMASSSAATPKKAATPKQSARDRHQTQGKSPDKGCACAVCGLEIRSGMNQHILIHKHSAVRSLPCTVCPRTWFVMQSQLSTHMNKYHGGLQGQGPGTGSGARTAKAKRKRMSTESKSSGQSSSTGRSPDDQLHHSDSSNLSAVVGMLGGGHPEDHDSASRSVSPAQHMKQCTVCAYQVPANEIGEHLQIHDTTDARRNVPCTLCPQTAFMNKEQLNKHIQNRHADQLAKYKAKRQRLMAAPQTQTQTETTSATQHNQSAHSNYSLSPPQAVHMHNVTVNGTEAGGSALLGTGYTTPSLRAFHDTNNRQSPFSPENLSILATNVPFEIPPQLFESASGRATTSENSAAGTSTCTDTSSSSSTPNTVQPLALPDEGATGVGAQGPTATLLCAYNEQSLCGMSKPELLQLLQGVAREHMQLYECCGTLFPCAVWLQDHQQSTRCVFGHKD